MNAPPQGPSFDDNQASHDRTHASLRHDGGKVRIKSCPAPWTLVSTLPYARPTGHLFHTPSPCTRVLEVLQGACSRPRLAAYGAVRCHYVQTIAAATKGNGTNGGLSTSVVIFGALVAFMNRMCEEELPDVYRSFSVMSRRLQPSDENMRGGLKRWPSTSPRAFSIAKRSKRYKLLRGQQHDDCPGRLRKVSAAKTSTVQPVRQRRRHPFPGPGRGVEGCGRRRRWVGSLLPRADGSAGSLRWLVSIRVGHFFFKVRSPLGKKNVWFLNKKNRRK